MSLLEGCATELTWSTVPAENPSGARHRLLRGSPAGASGTGRRDQEAPGLSSIRFAPQLTPQVHGVEGRHGLVLFLSQFSVTTTSVCGKPT